MDLKLIQRLIRMMERGGVGELEIEEKDGLRLRLRRGEAPAAAGPIVHVVSAGAGPAPAAIPAGALPSATGAGAAAAPAPAAPEGVPIPSPMVGTFYRAPSPDAEPFVAVGTRISVDQPLCIIEAMKVMNEIRAEVAGEILQLLVENGEPVEFGQPLFLIRPA